MSEELMHYGVLGMKWGHRTKASGTEIRAARNRLRTKQADYAVQRDKVKSQPKGSAARVSEQKKLSKIESDFKKNPDRVTAVRMTRGEKAAALVLAGPFGAIPIAATSAASRRFEFKQDKG